MLAPLSSTNTFYYIITSLNFIVNNHCKKLLSNPIDYTLSIRYNIMIIEKIRNTDFGSTKRTF